LLKIKEIDAAKHISDKSGSGILEYKFYFTWSHLGNPKTL